MPGRLSVAAAIAAALLAATAATPHARPRARVTCEAGQWVLGGELPRVGPPESPSAIAAIVLSEGTVAIPSVCPPVPARVRAGRRGARIAARWTGCEGVPRLRLKARTNADCTELTGRLGVPKKLKQSTKGPVTVVGVQDLCLVDPGVEPLEAAGGVVVDEPCSSAVDDLAAVLDDVCKGLQGGKPCAGSSVVCRRRTQELFAGTTLFPSAKQPPAWNNFGGRGELMAHAALCILKDLAAGPHENAATASVGIGDVEVKQRVGFTSFDLERKAVTGFHHVDFCLPVFGCLTGVGQTFTARVRASCPAHPLGKSCGTYPIRAAWALDVATTETTRYLGLVTPAIVVLTPYGPIEVTPTIQFRQNLGGIVAPYGSSPFKDHTLAFVDHEDAASPLPLVVDLLDRYGRIAGVEASAFGFVNAGWASQLGLGGRDPRPASPLWTPTGAVQEKRPDHDLGTARSHEEKTANVQVSAEAEVAYAPTDLLPAPLRSAGVDLHFKVFVRPKIDARVAAQLGVYFSEGWAFLVDPGAPSDAHTQVYLRDGAAAAGLFVVEAGFDLRASIDLGFPIGDITLVDVHEDLSIPLTDDEDDSRVGGAWRTARAGSSAPPLLPAFDGPVRTFHGDVDGPSFLAQCLAEPVPDQPKPEPSFLPTGAGSLVEDLPHPCNLCVVVPEQHIHQCAANPGFTNDQCPTDPFGNCPRGVPPGACHDVDYDATFTATKILLSNVNPLPSDKLWSCNGLTGGCFDLCRYDATADGVLTVVESAVDLVGPKCRLEPPA